MLDTDVYVKTDAGRDEIRSRAMGLSMSVRAILLMIDGQRTVAAMRGIIAGSKAPPDVLDTLATRGLIAPLAVSSGHAFEAPATGAPSASAVSAPAPQLPVAALPPEVYDAPLDLVLPTIYGPEAVDVGGAVPATPTDAAPQTPHDRYNHLYAMMNEIVRDFLAPHRRYFFQLKIERCSTAEDLLELLQNLHAALAKARGEAFASDVIARLRSAAAA